MKKLTTISAIVVFLFTFTANSSVASTYIDPETGHDNYSAGNCIMVTTREEADNNHVYTLNPDNTIYLNFLYTAYWDRNARCDELQFHVDHNTPQVRLANWLDSVARSWYDNISSTHYNHQTISTSRHEWFYVDEAGLHRIPDWLTATSWGLLISDRYSIPANHTIDFYDSVTITAPLNFSDGQYTDKINAIWKENDRNFSSIPSLLADEVNFMLNRGDGEEPYKWEIFDDCGYEYLSSGDEYGNLLDWSWMLRNPGCPLAD